MTVAKHTLIACMKGGNSEGVTGVGGGEGRLLQCCEGHCQCILYKNCNWLLSLKFKQEN